MRLRYTRIGAGRGFGGCHAPPPLSHTQQESQLSPQFIVFFCFTMFIYVKLYIEVNLFGFLYRKIQKIKYIGDISSGTKAKIIYI